MGEGINMQSSVIKKLKLNLVFASIFVLLALYVSYKFFTDKSWFLSAFFFISAILVIYVYFVSKRIPGRYLLPGVLLLCLFQIYPAFYSGYVAFTNDSNGHQLSKTQALDAIIEDSRIPVETQDPISYVVARNLNSYEVVLIFEYPNSQYWVGNSTSAEEVSPAILHLSGEGKVVGVEGYKILNSQQSSALADKLQSIVIHLKTGISLQPLDLQTLEAFQPVYKYSATNDLLVNQMSGEKFSPNNNGQMVGEQGEVLYPGWKSNIGWRNFTSIVHDQEIGRPLLAVLLWTFVNAFLVVVLSFLMGLALALTFNFQHLRSKRFYRTIFILPMAIPSVLSFLVWSGLFTAETGVIDRLFHISIPWLTDSFWARIAVLIVELWITFPYMFLITTGAVQAIPSEIIEAASIDGATTLKSFRLIKLPLVMRTVAPLLVASVAMALNNFGAIYLLTGGGPTFSNSNGNAGATDILISYTYKLAFNSQEGNNYGLASALSILNFILVGTISIYGLRRMKTMEGIN